MDLTKIQKQDFKDLYQEAKQQHEVDQKHTLHYLYHAYYYYYHCNS